MKSWLMYSCFLLLACNSGPKEAAVATQKKDSMISLEEGVPATNTDSNLAKDTVELQPPLRPATKKPAGVYQLFLPSGKTEKILHTVAFYPTTYRLQEEFGTKDSMVITEGTWAPSEGFIWLYKDQVLRGRYTWKGDTLQYYSPSLKKSFSMQKLEAVTVNEAWQDKRKEGSALYGVGTEPFWSVEVSKGDSVVLNMPDWNAPLRLLLQNVTATKDSSVYTAQNDSVKVIVYPVFCSDGMSDFLYTRKIKVHYGGRTLSGCGEIFRATR